MVVKIRGIMQCLRRVSWNNSHFVRFDLIPSRCGYHNLNCERHTGSQNDALLYLNVLKPVIIRKGSNVQSAKDTDMTPKDYRILYRFPHVPVCGFVNKVKKRFTTFMAVGVPTSYLLRLMDVISTDTFFFFITQGGVICCVLYSVGMIFYKLVGSVYLSSDRNTVKISYLDFWGKRVDVCCPLSDVVPFSDTNERIMDVYVNLRRYSTPQKLHFTVRFGSVLDTKLFNYVFGNINECE